MDDRAFGLTLSPLHLSECLDKIISQEGKVALP